MANGFHILIVDDRPDTVLGLVDLLTADRHRVEILDNSMEALSLLARKQTGPDPFHLVILDVNMPILDGPGLLRELRRRGDRVPAAYVTGYQSVLGRVQAEGNAMGLLGVLSKPPDQSAVAALLSKLTSGRTSTDGGETFFGTGRILRGRAATELGQPSEGVLSRTKVDEREQAAPLDIGAALEARPRANRTPVRNPAIQRTPTHKQPILPVPAPLTPQVPITDGIRRIRTPDPSAYYGPDGAALRGPEDPAVEPRNTLRRDPVTGSYSRKPSGLFPADVNGIPPTQGTTTAIRRSLVPQRPSELPVNPPGASPSPFTPAIQGRVPTPPSNQPPGTGSVRLRRGLSGNQVTPAQPTTRRETAGPPLRRETAGSPPVAGPPPTRVVACAHCAGVFQVLINAQPYAVQCVHCGQLNRIDPT